MRALAGTLADAADLEQRGVALQEAGRRRVLELVEASKSEVDQGHRDAGTLSEQLDSSTGRRPSPRYDHRVPERAGRPRSRRPADRGRSVARGFDIRTASRGPGEYYDLDLAVRLYRLGSSNQIGSRPMAIIVTTLGTGSPLPDPNRAGPSTLVQAGSTPTARRRRRGVLMRLAGAGVLPGMLDAVLLTHLHSDHITDLNDVITTHWVMAGSRPAPRLRPGPDPGGRRRDPGHARPDLGYRVAHHDDLTWTPIVEVHELAPPERLTIGDATMVVGATDHRPVEPTIGYRIEHDGRRGDRRRRCPVRRPRRAVRRRRRLRADGHPRRPRRS